MKAPFILEHSWLKALGAELEKPYLVSLYNFLQRERAVGKTVYPPEDLIFNALSMTPFDKVKVVIVGQDPYHGKGQAHGLSFSVPPGIKPPPSLLNIYKELESDLGIPQANHGSLMSWAEQGVLLLNATLTVVESTPLSHQGHGWETFTDAILEKLQARGNVAFLLWGRQAQEKGAFLDVPRGTNTLVLKAAHPSPFSCHRGFFGCRHFSKTNEFLTSYDLAPINWNLNRSI